MRKISILGTSGSGKTTLGREAARRLGAVPIDLDELHWEPNWVTATDEVFRARLEHALQAPSWVTSGNYSRVQEIYIREADTVVWLDYSFPVVMSRVVRRTFRRAVLGESCCNGNYESLQRTFSRDSVVLWALKTYRRRRRQAGAMLENPDFAHLQRLRHQTPRQTRQWLETLQPPRPAS